MADVSKIFKPRRGKVSTMLGTKASTVLAAGEMFFEVPDTGVGSGRGRIMMGDGSSTYVSLAGANNNTGANSQAAKYFMPFAQDEIIIHPGTDTKATPTAKSNIQSAEVATNLNAAKSGNALKTIIHNLREAIYKNAQDIVKLNNDISQSSASKSYIGMIIFSYTCDTQAKVIAQYGGTTWTQITDRFLYGSNSAGTTGGSNDAIVVEHSHNFTNGVAATAGAHGHWIQSFIIGPDGEHNHSAVPYQNSDIHAIGTAAYRTDANTSGYTSIPATEYNGAHAHTIPKHATDDVSGHTHTVTGTITSAGSSSTNANMPAYMTCYIWRRTA